MTSRSVQDLSSQGPEIPNCRLRYIGGGEDKGFLPTHHIQGQRTQVQVQPQCAFNYERCKMMHYKTWKLLYTKSNL